MLVEWEELVSTGLPGCSDVMVDMISRRMYRPGPAFRRELREFSSRRVNEGEAGIRRLLEEEGFGFWEREDKEILGETLRENVERLNGTRSKLLMLTMADHGAFEQLRQPGPRLSQGGRDYGTGYTARAPYRAASAGAGTGGTFSLGVSIASGIGAGVGAGVRGVGPGPERTTGLQDGTKLLEGDVCKTTSSVTVRKEEELESEILIKDLRGGAVLEVVGVGQGDRIMVRGQVPSFTGWISHQTCERLWPKG